MDFGTALRQLEAGRRVRRVDWMPGRYLKHDIVPEMRTVDCRVKGGTRKLDMSSADIHARDWRVVE